MVDLKRLGHLVALAEECHFARAAQRVHLSQPAFSRSIQSIERELGLQLFDRDAAGVKPTPAAAFFVERARRLLFDARNLQRDAALYRDGQLGDTAFGAGPFVAGALMPEVIAALRRAHPEAGVRLEISNWELLHERLVAEDIEFYVADARDIPGDAKLEFTPLGRHPAGLFVRAGHPLAGRSCRFAEAWSHGFATVRLPSAMQALIGKLIGLPEGGLPVHAFECDDMSLLRGLALETDTVIASSVYAVREDIEARRLRPLAVTDLPPVHSQMAVVALRQRTPSPMALRAIACVREVAARLNEAAP